MIPTTRSSFPTTAYGLALLIGAAGGVIYFTSPLRTARPAYKTPTASAARAAGEVTARLWEDPLHAVARRPEDSGAILHGENSPFADDAASLLVIPVAIPGGANLNEHENRLRSRYAVLAALDFQGYRPARRAVLRFYRFKPWPPVEESSGADNAEGTELVVPFELFEKEEIPPREEGDEDEEGTQEEEGDKNHDKALVIWIPDTALEEKPYERLQSLVKGFVGKDGVTMVEVRFLGPTSSDGFKEMAETEDPKLAFKEFTAFSSWATADMNLLNFEEPEPEKTPIKRTIASDLELMRTLLDELEIRGIDPTSDEIALISEWDTFYGRALPLTFAALVRAELDISNPEDDTATQEQGSPAPAEKKIGDEGTETQEQVPLKKAYEAIRDHPSEWPSNLSRAVYLAGLDGRTATSEQSSTTSNAAAEQKEDESVAALERPEGQSQLDYARRLAVDLRERKSRDLKAIGVLGSDVYDKLLLIQALREQFPHALFFTTDLDARLLHPTQNRWTRNLIVASSFGLRLIEDDPDEEDPAEDDPDEEKLFRRRQLELPPFRDGYQSALHLAALLALGAELDAGEYNTPKIYEVGRSGAVLLSQPSESTPAETQRAAPSTMQGLDGLRAMAFVLVAAVALSVALWRILASGEDWTKEGVFRAVVAAIILIVFAALILRFAGPGEPFAFFQGISIWPTEILRLVAAGLAIGLLIYATCRLRQNDKELTKEFHLGVTDAEAEELGYPRMRTILSELSAVVFPDWRPSDEESEGEKREELVDVKIEWTIYQNVGRPQRRRKRVVIAAIVYVLLALPLFVWLGFPIVPYRGGVARWADLFALFACVAPFVLLIFYVIDVVSLDSWFIKKLSTAPSKWPNEALPGGTENERDTDVFLRDWLDVHFVARRTKVVGSLVVAPFFILALLIVSRLSYFDRWDWPISLIAVFGINSVLALASVLMLRRAAERARKLALERLGDHRLQRLADTSPRDDGSAGLIKQLIEEITNESEGAFAPLPQHPVVGAFLLPFGSIAAVGILEFLATAV